ncbi:MAG: FAD-dependent oxidoreductase [Desulfobacteraceae bacterium]|jgi:NADPH-dependent 2,4-dienoyl-CoA reductase/sulfur reductase-like enzyme
MRFVIIGGDAAGMSAASRARRNQKDLEIIVLEATGDVSYSACGMPYNLADPERDMDDLVVREASVFREKQGIDLRLGHRAEAIDRQAKKVRGTTSDGSPFGVAYDKLLIATGASPIIPNIPGADLPGVVALKSLEDGRRIKQLMAERNVKRAVIAGMGYIGLEMAESFHERGVHVDMVKPRAQLLPWMHEQLSALIQEELEAHDVGLLTGQRIEGIEAAGDGLRVKCTSMELDTDLVLFAIGVRPSNEIAKQAGLDLGPGEAIAVNPSLQTTDPDIYSVGDCADAFHVVTGQRVWVPLALRANRGGRAVADHVTGAEVALQGIAGTAIFKVFDLQVARTGLSLKEAQDAGFDPVESVIFARSRAHRHPGASRLGVYMIADRKTRKLLGVQILGREGIHRIDAAAVGLHAGMTVEEFHECDLAYAPPFGPTWDPLHIAAQQVMKQLQD